MLQLTKKPKKTSIDVKNENTKENNKQLFNKYTFETSIVTSLIILIIYLIYYMMTNNTEPVVEPTHTTINSTYKDLVAQIKIYLLLGSQVFGITILFITALSFINKMADDSLNKQNMINIIFCVILGLIAAIILPILSTVF